MDKFLSKIALIQTCYRWLSKPISLDVFHLRHPKQRENGSDFFSTICCR